MPDDAFLAALPARVGALLRDLEARQTARRGDDSAALFALRRNARCTVTLRDGGAALTLDAYGADPAAARRALAALVNRITGETDAA